MINNNILAEKSKAFGVRIVNCRKYLTTKKHEYMMSDQIYRSGTSIGANIHEGIYAQSKADFINKLQVAQKEAGETDYWLEVICSTEYLTREEYDSMKADNDEIIKLLTSIIKSTKNQEQKNY